jgi:hypothetical protein
VPEPVLDPAEEPEPVPDPALAEDEPLPDEEPEPDPALAEDEPLPDEAAGDDWFEPAPEEPAGVSVVCVAPGRASATMPAATTLARPMLVVAERTLA